MTDAETLEYAQNLQRAKQIQAGGTSADASGNGEGAPGAQAMGVSDGPTPAAEAPDWGSRIKDALIRHAPGPLAFALNPSVQDATGRALDYVGGATRTTGAAAIGAATPGLKNPVTMQDVGNTLLGKAPGVGDYAVKMGQPDANLFTIPGTKRQLKVSDLENVVGNAVTNPLSYGAAGWAGKKLYNNSIAPLEVEGARFGKSEVGDELFKNGIKNPLKLREQVQAVVDRNMEQVRALEKQGAAGGGQVDMESAMAPAQKVVNQFRAGAVEPEDIRLAQRMQNAIDSYRGKGAKPSEQILRELPYTSPVEKLQPQAELPAYQANSSAPVTEMQPNPYQGRKFTGRTDAEAPVAGSPADKIISLPRQAQKTITLEPRVATVLDETEPTLGPSPVEGAAMKRKVYAKAKPSAYDSLRNPGDMQAMRKAQGAGLKQAVEDAVGQGAGPEAAAQYRDLNDSTGKMLSTGKAQERVGNLAQREFDAATSPIPTGTESIAGALQGAHDGLASGLTTAALIKALRAVRLSQMPVGYGLRSMSPEALRLGVIGSQINPYGGQDNGQEK